MEATIKALKARANAHNLAVYVDKHTDSFYIADRATNTVIAPPPMNIFLLWKHGWTTTRKKKPKNDIARPNSCS